MGLHRRRRPAVPALRAFRRGVLGRILPGWDARRERVSGQDREDLGHRDRSPGESALCEAIIGFGVQGGER